ncbi:twin-arginine translocation signal domain-containing protein [Parapusillimonas sp. SGNA-6]|nr:twin-arginine translocation signal domain-containing protein [Parapusillimonas sp. SGNA-6]
MDMTRRGFIKAGSAACIVLLPGFASAADGPDKHNTSAAEVDASIEKSIKACFGGRCSVRAHAAADGLTYADIEHLGYRYAVVSTDTLDWTVLRTL